MFYSAFKNQDAESMAPCYHDDIIFKNPIFGLVKVEHAKNIWRRLLSSQKGKYFKGNTKWKARYNFGKTGRPVHNKTVANFEIDADKIIQTILICIHGQNKRMV